MRFIDKSVFMEKGHQITDGYLDHECKLRDTNGDYWYQNVLYDDNFRCSGAKGEMLELAKRSQNNLCCYCMRELSEESTVTLEHIIPQSVSEKEFAKYLHTGSPWLKAESVIRTADFTGKINIPIPPRPHTVTFENLTASCNGAFPETGQKGRCCNNRRGNKWIVPIFYWWSVQSQLQYTNDGRMYPCENSELREECMGAIETAGLNCTSLKRIRRLWRLMRNVPINEIEEGCNDKTKRKLILFSVLYKKDEFAEIDEELFNTFIRDEYWATFWRYRWFHTKI